MNYFLKAKNRLFIFFLLMLYHVSCACDSADCSLDTYAKPIQSQFLPTIARSPQLDSLCVGAHATEGKVIGLYEERDLELFTTNDQASKGVFARAFAPSTSFGGQQLKKHLKNPLSNISHIKLRQQQLDLIKDPALLRQIKEILADIGKNEEGLHYFLQQTEDSVAHQVIKKFYFQWDSFKKFNNSSLALDVRNYVKYLGLLGPVLEHVILHFAIEHVTTPKLSERSCGDSEHSHNHGGHKCLAHGNPSPTASPLVKAFFFLGKAGHFCFHAIGINTTIQELYAEKEIIKQMHKKVTMALSCLASMKKLCFLLQAHGYNAQAFGLDEAHIAYFNNPQSVNHKALLACVDGFQPNADDNFGLFSRIGETLSCYQLLRNQAKELNAMTLLVGDIDALTSVATWYNSAHDHKKLACAVDFIESDKPMISIKQGWHIALDKDKATPNDIQLGGDSAAYMIVSGPNKAGKSSILRLTGCNIILAQTFGVAAAQTMRMTIVHKLISHITVHDDTLKGKSMMAAEIIRAERCVDLIKNLEADQVACVLIDDTLFKGTTFRKSEELSKQFVETLAATPGCCGIVVTHMAVLTELGKSTPHTFKNYCIDVLVNRQGKTQSTFRLKEGVADPEAVFAILQSQGHVLS